MQPIKTLSMILTLALAVSACSTDPSHGSNDVQIEKVGTQSISEALTFWDWMWGTGTSAPAPDTVERPGDRALVICSVWCPSGYTRRDVTIGPTCSWYHFTKCVDNTGYIGEDCAFTGHECADGLTCGPSLRCQLN